MIQAITFLGNPGPEHAHTRHNFAWLLLDQNDWAHLSWQSKFQGRFASTLVDNQTIWLLKPLTFMNKSGKSVQSLISFYKLQPEKLLVVHDDLELEFGVVGFKKGGGLSGHNGLRSIVQSIGTKDFFRFRLGISRPSHKNISSYVLSKFTEQEQNQLHGLFKHADTILRECLTLEHRIAEKRFGKEQIL